MNLNGSVNHQQAPKNVNKKGGVINRLLILAWGVSEKRIFHYLSCSFQALHHSEHLDRERQIRLVPHDLSVSPVSGFSYWKSWWVEVINITAFRVSSFEL